jgi:hypothetical protein
MKTLPVINHRGTRNIKAALYIKYTLKASFFLLSSLVHGIDAYSGIDARTADFTV